MVSGYHTRMVAGMSHPRIKGLIDRDRRKVNGQPEGVRAQARRYGVSHPLLLWIRATNPPASYWPQGAAGHSLRAALLPAAPTKAGA